MEYTKIFEIHPGIKNGMSIFIICLIFVSFMPSLVEAKSADEWYNEGLALYLSGNYAEAIKAYDEALKINPQYAEAWTFKGIVLSELGRNDEANKAFDEALKINPRIAEAWFNKGIALKKLGINDEANKAFDEASKLEKSPGFEIIFAIAGLIMIAHLMRRRG